MVDNVRYTIHTHTIPIEFFLGMIEGDIKKLIQTYGHKNCGLMHEELCEKIKKIITSNKTLILSPLDQYGKNKLNREWKSHKKEFFNKLFEKEGFINMCEPLQNKGNPNLQKLKLKHIEFCKKRDTWKAEVEANPEYNACKNYDTWIEKERASFTHEYLNNVKKFTSRTVHKYFSTEEHPQGHDPVKTYLKSKLDCKKYNPPPSSQPKGQVAKIPTNSQHPPTIPNVKQVSNEKNGRSVPDLDSGSAKKELDANISPKSKHLTPDSQKYSPSQTQPGATPTIQDISLIPKAPVSTVNRNEEKQDATPIEGQPPKKSLPSAQAEAPPKAKSTPLPRKVTSPTPATHSVPEATATTGKNTTLSQTPFTSPSLTITSNSSLNSGSPLPSNPLPPAADNKGQDRTIQPSTTSETLTTTHHNQSVPSTTPSDSSLPQSQPPAMNTLPNVTSAQGPGTPATASASTVTITTAAPVTATITTTYTIQNPISSSNEAPGTNESQKPPPPQDASEPKATAPNTGKINEKNRIHIQ
ncbi:hypothetical protein POVWA1_085020 [Plasmodium ovale wallikeri]|uniref:STP1 protein n=1 Tax=Plasmodium ovale wallikeri TaxID=864142 RepID=A0A1A9AP52_PLAOA|nr:hypothetical protein POVWA1_085020 [Plasmodium ovale wallikeri]